jgi:mono/diheme cytochrome c family protein
MAAMGLRADWVVGLLLAGAALGAGGTAAQPQPPPDPGAGGALARQLCASCHLVADDQPGPVPDGIPSFRTISAQPHIDASYLKGALVESPHPLMPDPPLTNRQLVDVVAYILSLRD